MIIFTNIQSSRFCPRISTISNCAHNPAYLSVAVIWNMCNKLGIVFIHFLCSLSVKVFHLRRTGTMGDKSRLSHYSIFDLDQRMLDNADTRQVYFAAKVTCRFWCQFYQTIFGARFAKIESKVSTKRTGLIDNDSFHHRMRYVPSLLHFESLSSEIMPLCYVSNGHNNFMLDVVN